MLEFDARSEKLGRSVVIWSRLVLLSVRALEFAFLPHVHCEKAYSIAEVLSIAVHVTLRGVGGELLKMEACLHAVGVNLSQGPLFTSTYTVKQPDPTRGCGGRPEG